jgi:transcription antitermination protein NusB
MSSRSELRSVARMSAVQALYEMDITQKGVHEVLEEFRSFWIGREIDDDLEMKEAETKFFGQIVEGVIKDQVLIDRTIDQALSKGWPLVRIELVLRAIMRAGVFELLLRKDIPPRVSISEYVDVTRAFYGEDEPGMVNAVLDHIARENRLDELGAKRA